MSWTVIVGTVLRWAWRIVVVTRVVSMVVVMMMTVVWVVPPPVVVVVVVAHVPVPVVPRVSWISPP